MFRVTGKSVRACDPGVSLSEIQENALHLSPKEKVALIDLLWKSLDETRLGDIEKRWATESEDRIDAYEHGELSATDDPAALRELRASLRK